MTSFVAAALLAASHPAVPPSTPPVAPERTPPSGSGQRWCRPLVAPSSPPECRCPAEDGTLLDELDRIARTAAERRRAGPVTPRDGRIGLEAEDAAEAEALEESQDGGRPSRE
ncbi:MAG TPA: hypothetical protein VML50_13090 [Anaeromyxobacter sp.]|nr:hypothetical protein [Anaeromyxobacter sp.]